MKKIKKKVEKLSQVSIIYFLSIYYLFIYLFNSKTSDSENSKTRYNFQILA